jgi:hypothetical protein
VVPGGSLNVTHVKGELRLGEQKGSKFCVAFAYRNGPEFY